MSPACRRGLRGSRAEAALAVCAERQEAVTLSTIPGRGLARRAGARGTERRGAVRCGSAPGPPGARRADADAASAGPGSGLVVIAGRVDLLERGDRLVLREPRAAQEVDRRRAHLGDQ